MIDRDEIEAHASRMGVHVANVERDYVFGWLLKSFYENEYLAPLLVFKGGNCMRKAFYPETRFSGDLDFSVQASVDLERMQAEINRACLAAQAACGVRFQTDKNSLEADRKLDNERQSYKGRVYFWDFYGKPGTITISIRVDITEFERIYLPTLSRGLLHPYSDAHACQVDLRCMSLEELLANKLKCLIQRRHSFDLYDLVYAAFFERSIEVDRALVLRTFLKKTIFEQSPAAAKEILLGLPMPFFKAAWSKYVSPVGGRLEFERAEEGFRTVIESIFQGVSRGWGVLPFYPSQYRNLIMEAGVCKRLMLLTYEDGRERKIEPYSLAYKRKKDGSASEYLYVWDRTSNPPGLRQFFHHKIRKLELTDEVFEPQFTMELSKAGEPASKEHFGRPFSDRGGRRRIRRTIRRQGARSPFMSIYRVECPYCQKRFKRTQATTVLKPHKDPNGYPCAGRTGYFV